MTLDVEGIVDGGMQTATRYHCRERAVEGPQFPRRRVIREDVRSGALRRVLPGWLAGESTITALIPYRQGLLPSVRVFIDHLAAEFPKAVLL
jgi:DNA-binding transcriptional LysR family regulator